MGFSIGIEACGKSLTVVAIADERGRILTAQRHRVRLNYHENSKAALATDIFRLVKQILQVSDITVSDFCQSKGTICAGITGISTAYDREKGMEEVWQAAGLAEAVRITTGGIEIAFTGATRALKGAAITSHVGSAALARTAKSIRRVGGWGPLLGDEGSAYWIGRRALNSLCRLRDGRLERTGTKLDEYILEDLSNVPLWKELMSEHEKVSRKWTDALIPLAQRTNDRNEFRYIVSDLAKSVFRAWEKNPRDVIARQIVEKATSELLDQVEQAISSAELSIDDMPLVIWGGLFRHNKAFAEYTSRMALKRFPTVKLINPHTPEAMRPVVGALVFALAGSKFSLPPSRVLLQMEEDVNRFAELRND